MRDVAIGSVKRALSARITLLVAELSTITALCDDANVRGLRLEQRSSLDLLRPYTSECCIPRVFC